MDIDEDPFGGDVGATLVEPVPDQQPRSLSPTSFVPPHQQPRSPTSVVPPPSALASSSAIVATRAWMDQLGALSAKLDGIAPDMDLRQLTSAQQQLHTLLVCLDHKLTLQLDQLGESHHAHHTPPRSSSSATSSPSKQRHGAVPPDDASVTGKRKR
jgi:hypothetical protein